MGRKYHVTEAEREEYFQKKWGVSSINVMERSSLIKILN